MIKQKKIKYYYDQNKAEKIERFFRYMLVYPDGSKAGQPFELHPYQIDFLRQTNGWFVKGRDVLKHKNNYLEVAKGNGKTPLMAGLALFKAGWADIINGEIYLLAGTRKQAKILLRDCKNMIRLSPNMKGLFIVRRDSVTHIKTGTKIEALSAEAGAHHGPRPNLIIFDEMHVQPDSELYDTMVEALFKKKSAQCYMITTAGVVNTFAEEIHKYAKKVQNGIVDDPTWYAKIYAAEHNDDPYSEETWQKPNPGLGTIKDIDELRAMAVTVSQFPIKLNSFKRLQLNIWTNALTAWLPIATFDRSNKAPIDLEYHKENQTPCFCGLDLASTDDLSAFSMMFVEENDKGEPENIDWVCYFWCPNDTILRRAKDNNVNYPLWLDQGLIFSTPGEVQDKNMIFEFIQAECAKYNVKIVNTDTSSHNTIVSGWVENSNINFVGHGQGIMAMSTPTKELGIYISTRVINHAGNPVLRWQITECEAWSDANENIKLMKGTGRGKGAGKRRKKIDGIISGVMALSGYMSKPETDKNEASDWWS